VNEETDDELNRRLAVFDGFYPNSFIAPGGKWQGEKLCGDDAGYVGVPNYCSDLNAVAIVEAGLQPSLLSTYFSRLEDVIIESKDGRRVYLATARQRTLALIRSTQSASPSATRGSSGLACQILGHTRGSSATSASIGMCSLRCRLECARSQCRFRM